MIKIANVSYHGFIEAIRGMRNPMNSWDKSDSVVKVPEKPSTFVLGDADRKLMLKLANGGSDDRKFMRMITVYADITAPLYWWKEFDTYKVGTVANSCSTMHTLHKKPLNIYDFSHEKLNSVGIGTLEALISYLNSLREDYCLHGNKESWDQMIQLLPSSFNQKRTIMLNYEVLKNIYHARRNHKLQEWHIFCEWIKNLRCSELITGINTEDKENVVFNPIDPDYSLEVTTNVCNALIKTGFKKPYTKFNHIRDMMHIIDEFFYVLPNDENLLLYASREKGTKIMLGYSSPEFWGRGVIVSRPSESEEWSVKSFDNAIDMISCMLNYTEEERVKIRDKVEEEVDEDIERIINKGI